MFDIIRLHLPVSAGRPVPPSSFLDAALRFREILVEASRASPERQSLCTAILSQKLSPDPEKVRHHQKPPLPFALLLPSEEVGTSPREGISVTLAGVATQAVPLFVDALAVLAESMAALGVTAGEACSIDRSGALRPVVSGDISIISGDDFILDHQETNCVKVAFLSPLRLVRKGCFLRKFEPALFMMSVVRRISAFAAYYGGEDIDADFARIAELAAALRPDDVRLYPVPQGAGGFNGLAGSVKLAGTFTELYPFLSLGQFFNCGKGSALGYGRYTVTRC